MLRGGVRVGVCAAAPACIGGVRGKVVLELVLGEAVVGV